MEAQGPGLSLQCGWQGLDQEIGGQPVLCSTLQLSTPAHTQSGCWVTVLVFLWNLATVSLGCACMTSWLQ